MATIMDDYAQRMASIKLTPQMRAAIKRRIADERPNLAQADVPAHVTTRPRPARRPDQRTHTRRRVIAIAACTAGLVLGCTALGILWSQKNPGILWSQKNPAPTNDGTADEEKQGASSNDSALSATQPSFVLVAYADGTPVDDRGDTVLAGPGFLDSVGSWDAGPDDDGGMSCHNVFNIDLRAYGDDIVQLDYRIDGDSSAQFCYLGSRSYQTPDGSFEEMHGQELTITQDMLERVGTIDGGTFSLEMTFALPDEYRALYEESHATGDSDEFRFESIAYGAQLLAGRVITVTASFDDGTTLTHEYRIEPVDDFKDALMRNSQAFSESIDAGTTEELTYEPLFTIEQLS